MQYWVIDEEVQVEVVDDVIDDVAWLLATPLDPIWQVSNFCWRWTLNTNVVVSTVHMCMHCTHCLNTFSRTEDIHIRSAFTALMTRTHASG